MAVTRHQCAAHAMQAELTAAVLTRCDRESALSRNEHCADCSTWVASSMHVGHRLCFDRWPGELSAADIRFPTIPFYAIVVYPA